MKMKKGPAAKIAAVLLCVLMLLLCGGCELPKKTALDPDNPVTVTIWNYYNGDQLAAFERLVEQFNSTIGMEKGIVVVNVSQGSINPLADALISSAKGEAGAQELPTLAAVYAETAFILDEMDVLEPLDSYFTAEELAAYVPGFIDEGRFNADNELLLFPFLKSTELFTANETDWAPFAQQTGITIESIKTKEDLVTAAKSYYEWTDAQTPDVAEDGKALYGRDSISNYVYIGCRQLGHELFKIADGKADTTLDKATFRTLWDNFYVPYINGYFGAYAKFRSEDCKTGKILALTSSSSSVSYLPVAVTLADDTTHDITTYISKDLPFADAVDSVVVQQGASYCLLKSTPGQQEGAVEFIKWFTQSSINIDFALMSGYSPVTAEANNDETITAAYAGDTSTPKGQNILNALLISAKAFSDDTAYAGKPFSGSKDTRTILGDLLQKTAETDRAAVVAAIEGGATRAQATADYLTDEYFDAWFAELTSQINAAVGK